MKEYKFYGTIGENRDTENFRSFMLEVQNRINQDQELVERAKKVNNDFFAQLQEIKSENSNYCGSAVINKMYRLPRYAHIKNLEFQGEKYDAEIDLLTWSFQLI